MTSSLASRLGDIPGVASVVVDLDGSGRGIDVRLEPGADEAEVMEKLRALLAAYGVRRGREPTMNRDSSRLSGKGVKLSITPMNDGVRIEVAATSVKSFRIVTTATPLSVSQGLADAWCQVIGRIPVEIVGVSVDESGHLTVTASDGEQHTQGSAKIDHGWIEALAGAMAGVLYDSGRTGLNKAAS